MSLADDRHLALLRATARSMPNAKVRREFIEAQHTRRDLPLVIRGVLQEGKTHPIGGCSDEVYAILLADLQADEHSSGGGR